MSIKIIASTAVAAVAATVFAVPASAAPARGVTHLHAAKSHVVTIKSTLRPGLAHLHNDGVRPVIVIRKKHAGADELVRLGNSKHGSDQKRVFKLFTFVAALDSHSDSYLRLSRGTYFLLDATVNKLKAAKVRTVSVRGKASNAVRPASTRNITISKKGTLSGATTGGPRPYVRLRNAGSNPHAIFLMKVASKVTDAQLKDALASRSTEQLFSLVDESTFLGALLVAYPHQDVATRVNLTRARYLVVSDRAFSDDGETYPAGTVRQLTLR